MTCSVLGIYLLFPLAGAFDLVPPVMPPAFTISFKEMVSIKTKERAENFGFLSYSINMYSMRIDKFEGQVDVLCHESLLNIEHPSAYCELLFANDKRLYIIYPEQEKCCRLCEPEKQCTVIKDTWLLNSTYVGNVTFDGSICFGWQIRGATTIDTWYVRTDGVPCQLRTQSFNGDIMHNFTFYQESFVYNPPPKPAVFEIPKYCTKKCPIPYPG